jgi:MscS family membrane protein
VHSVRKRITLAQAALFLAALLFCSAPAPAHGQIPKPPPQQPAPPQAEVDPLGRDTPRGTISGFTAAVHREDFVAAAAFMQLTTRQRPNVDTLARTLTALLDQYFTRPVAALSGSPAGITTDGLPLDRERITLTLPRGPADVVLKRVSSPQGELWLISSETLAQVPAWGRTLEASWIDRTMPTSLVTRTFAGVSWAEWIVWALSIAAPMLLYWLISVIALALARRSIHDVARRLRLDAWAARLRRLMVAVMAAVTHLALLPWLSITLHSRLVYGRCVVVVLVLLLAVLIWRVMGLSFAQARDTAQRRGKARTQSLMLVGERLLKVLLVLVSIVILLTLIGVRTTTALAGVGIGGVALALGAQKSVENLLGAIFLLTDHALAIGDFCRVADRVGWIEDITLRSVRLRTLEQTLVSIPAGVLSQANIENFTTRNKMLLQNTLGVRYGTSVQQLRSIVDQIHALILVHPDLEVDSARIRVTSFGAHAIELELFAYVKTADMARFVVVREDLLLAAAAIVESEGSAFARPTDFLYLRQDASEARTVSPSS